MANDKEAVSNNVRHLHIAHEKLQIFTEHFDDRRE